MRLALLLAAIALSACAAPATTQLAAADGATALIVGERMYATRTAAGSSSSDDPVVYLTLAHADGRRMRFEQANHAPAHLWAQEPGGALAQAMGLFGAEQPTLFIARANTGAPFICPTEGPVAIGMYEGADNVVRIVGLRQEFQFDEREDGTHEALPYSPDQVCARLSLRRM